MDNPARSHITGKCIAIRSISRGMPLWILCRPIPPILLIKVPPRLASSTFTNFPFDFHHAWHASRLSYFVNSLRNYRDSFHSRSIFVRYNTSFISYYYTGGIVRKYGRHCLFSFICIKKSYFLLYKKFSKIRNTSQNWKLRIIKDDCRMSIKFFIKSYVM